MMLRFSGVVLFMLFHNWRELELCLFSGGQKDTWSIPGGQHCFQPAWCSVEGSSWSYRISCAPWGLHPGILGIAAAGRRWYLGLVTVRNVQLWPGFLGCCAVHTTDTSLWGPAHTSQGCLGELGGQCWADVGAVLGGAGLAEGFWLCWDELRAFVEQEHWVLFQGWVPELGLLLPRAVWLIASLSVPAPLQSCSC